LHDILPAVAVECCQWDDDGNACCWAGCGHLVLLGRSGTAVDSTEQIPLPRIW